MSYAWGHYITIPGLTVAGDLSAKQYMAVRHASTAGQILANNSTTVRPLGVLVDAPDASGEAATVVAMGVVTMVSGTSAASAGAALGVDTTGRAVDGQANNYGLFLEAPTAVGDLIKVIWGVG